MKTDGSFIHEDVPAATHTAAPLWAFPCKIAVKISSFASFWGCHLHLSETWVEELLLLRLPDADGVPQRSVAARRYFLWCVISCRWLQDKTSITTTTTTTTKKCFLFGDVVQADDGQNVWQAPAGGQTLRCFTGTMWWWVWSEINKKLQQNHFILNQKIVRGTGHQQTNWWRPTSKLWFYATTKKWATVADGLRL